MKKKCQFNKNITQKKHLPPSKPSTSANMLLFTVKKNSDFVLPSIHFKYRNRAIILNYNLAIDKSGTKP